LPQQFVSDVAIPKLAVIFLEIFHDVINDCHTAKTYTVILCTQLIYDFVR